ncbi:hypothetical protein BASA81_005106 [Batrachochytrium salamandrivorans]|nr:hypothetical protein BASA81_005106 [Batrachochytrium salamandrivorans]
MEGSGIGETESATKANFRSYTEYSLFSRLFFAWVFPLIRLGYRQDLDQHDLFAIDSKSDPELLRERFWAQKVQGKSTLRSLWHVFRIDILLSGALFLIYSSTRFIGPFLLGQIVTYVTQYQQKKPTTVSLEMAYGCAALLCLSQMIGSLCQTQATFLSMSTGLRCRSVLAASTFTHLLSLSAMSNQAQEGHILSLVSTDSLVFIEFAKLFNQFWSAPIILIAGVIYIQVLIGPSVWAGMSILVIFVPVSYYLGKSQMNWQRKKVSLTDERVRICSEVLASIRIVKFNAWELALEKIMQFARDKEFDALTGLEYVRAGSTPLAVAIPNVASVITFLTYVGLGNELTPANTFSVISLFVVIRSPFVTLPQAINQVARLLVALKRFDDFFQLKPRSGEEGGPLAANEALEIAPGSTFAWSETSGDEFKLQVGDDGIELPAGSFTAVCGTVASGKTSLLLALAQEMQQLSGLRPRTRPSRTAYCCQEPFIINSTIRENILFGLPMKPDWYLEVVRNACLVDDINQFEGGDLCEIGSRGVNLSGGQKARLALARALYSEPTTLFLDDPLAALDSVLGKRIFDHLCRLRNVTRVLVTNNLHLLQQVDWVVHLERGKVDSFGSSQAYLAAHPHLLTKAEETKVEAEDETSGVFVIDEGEEEQERPPVAASSLRPQLKTEQSQFAMLTTAEGRVKGVVSNKVLWLYWISGARGSMLVIVVVLLLFVLAECLFLSVDAFLATQTSNSTMSTSAFLAVYSLLTLGSVTGILLRSFMFTRFHLSAAQSLYDQAVSTIFRLPMSFYWTEPSGRVLNRYSADQNSVDTNLGQAWLWLLLCVVRVMGILVLICIAIPIFAVCLLPIFLVYYIIRQLYRPSARDLQRIVAVSQSPIMHKLTETLNGRVVLELFPPQTKQWWITNTYAVIVNAFQAKFSCDVLSDCWLSLYLEFLGAVVVLLTGLIIVALRDQVSSGFAGLALAYALNIVINLNMSVRQAVLVEQLMNGVERLNEYAELPAEKDLFEVGGEDGIAAPAVAPAWPETGLVVFHNVVLKYRNEANAIALDSLSVTFASGEHCGIVGKSGGGKSTLFAALLRLVDLSSGSIFLDGVDVTTVSKQLLRSKIVVVPQEAVVFKGTLRYNVDPFKERTDLEVWQALRDSSIDSLALNNDLETPLGEISVGERALICMARAILRPGRVVLLDEASSALDSKTDLKIQHTIRQKFASSTLLMIAHRLDTVIDLDSILVIGQGRVVEKASAFDLLQNPNSAFSNLVRETGKKNEQGLKLRSQNALVPTTTIA